MFKGKQWRHEEALGVDTQTLSMCSSLFWQISFFKNRFVSEKAFWGAGKKLTPTQFAMEEDDGGHPSWIK